MRIGMWRADHRHEGFRKVRRSSIDMAEELPAAAAAATDDDDGGGDGGAGFYACFRLFLDRLERAGMVVAAACAAFVLLELSKYFTYADGGCWERGLSSPVSSSRPT